MCRQSCKSSRTVVCPDRDNFVNHPRSRNSIPPAIKAITLIVWLSILFLGAAAQDQSDDMGNYTDDVSNSTDPENIPIGDLSEQSPPTEELPQESFLEKILPCFIESGNHSSTVALPSCSETDIWGNMLLTSARYGAVSVRAASTWTIDYTAFSNLTYARLQIVNPANALVGVPISGTLKADPQSICDQSAIYMLRLVSEKSSDFTALNSSLPPGFKTGEGNVRQNDCASHREIGLKVLQAWDQYQKDCFGICLSPPKGNISRCGFRRALGQVLDSIFNNVDSNVMNRLRFCPSAKWFLPNATAAVVNVFDMCASNVQCALMCSGDTVNTAYRLQQYQAISNTTNNKRSSPLQLQAFANPSLVMQYVKPLRIVSKLLGQPEVLQQTNFENKWTYLDSLTNPTDGMCRSYDRAISDLLQSTGQEYSPLDSYQPTDSLLAIAALRTTKGKLCVNAAAKLQSFCNQRSNILLCARAANPQVSTKGSFYSCQDENLRTYYQLTVEYNERCVAMGLPARPTNGPKRKYLLPRTDSRLEMADCFPDDMDMLYSYIALGLFAWFVVLVLIAYGQYSNRRWLASCDVTMDVCRSRSFTVAGTLWLLYAYYCFYNLFLSQINLRTCAQGICSFYFPTVLYLFLTSLLWVSAFGWLMIGNNPYRAHGWLWSLTALGLSHGLTYLIILRLLDSLDRYWDDDGVKWYLHPFFVGLQWDSDLTVHYLGKLFGRGEQLCLDITYLVFLVVGPLLGWGSFNDHRNKVHADYIHEILDHPPEQAIQNRFGEYQRLYVTCARPAAEALPQAKDVGQALAAAAERSSDCVVVAAVRDVPATAHHSARGKALGLQIVPETTGQRSSWAVFQAEILVVKQAICTRDAEARAALLDHATAEADKEGRRADAARLRRERRYCGGDVPVVGTADLAMLRDVLRNPLFATALADGSAEVYWPAALAAVREYARLQAGRQPDRATPTTKEAFRAVGREAGLTALDIEAACYLQDPALQRYVMDFGAALVPTSAQGEDELIASTRLDGLVKSIEVEGRRILEAGRTGLVIMLDQEGFTEWVGRQGRGKSASGDTGAMPAMAETKGEYGSGLHPYGLASSCLDAYHFAMIGALRKEGSPLNPTPAAQIAHDLVQRGNRGDFKGCLGRTLGVSPRSEMLTSARWRADGMVEKEVGPPVEMQRVTFAPSILFVCVGIAAIITSQQFVNSMANVVQYNNLLTQGVDALRQLQSFVVNFAYSALGIAGCVTPASVNEIKALTPGNYARALAQWQPMSDLMHGVVASPEVQAILVQSIMATTQAVLFGDMSDAGQAVKQAASNIAKEMPGAMMTAATPYFANMSRPEVLATLPVLGAPASCLGKQLQSDSVKAVIKQGQDYANALKVTKPVIIDSMSLDPCRDHLLIYGCEEHWRAAYPVALAARQDLFAAYDAGSSLPQPFYEVYNVSAASYKTTVPKACQYYETRGCVAVLSFAVAERSADGWFKALNRTRDIMKDYIAVFDDTLSYVVFYASSRVIPCYLAGHAFAFLTSMLVALNVLHQFHKRLLQMRQGRNPYRGIIEKKPAGTFSSTATPTLGGMVLATAYAQYYVWAYLIFLVLTVVTSDRFYVLIFHAGGVWIILEVAVGYFIARALLEGVVGKRYIFQNSGDMCHPVLWTWYSTYLVLVNLLKGLLAGIIRMVNMIIMLILQIGVMDRSNFPEGEEARDPAFVAFLSTLMFHHRYRNPLFTAFAYKYEQLKKDADPSSTPGDMPAGIEDGYPSSGAVDKGREQQRNGMRTRRRWLLALTLHCNPGVAAFKSDSVAPPDDDTAAALPTKPVRDSSEGYSRQQEARKGSGNRGDIIVRA